MICPRCDGPQAKLLAEAPKDKSWEVYLCPDCFFSWRSTEDEAVINPAKYDVKFKIKREELDKLLAIPPIPPLQDKG